MEADPSLEMELWRKRWSAESWKEYLAAGETEAEITAIRRCTHTGRPLGASEFVHSLEKATQRHLAPQKGGRPSTTVNRQAALDFEK
jgi:hypothetical protein